MRVRVGVRVRVRVRVRRGGAWRGAHERARAAICSCVHTVLCSTWGSRARVRKRRRMQLQRFV